MNITINQTPHQLPDGATVADALAAITARPPFAVAVNTVFVPSTEHARHLLQAGDRVEVISPVTGG
ncbi:sulfur carrier protein ThiS [Acidovorax sp. SRB_24]|uniref:sulfur carrier protein ThiS n=1 Tax=Acidovorax sp. SRB_24 TaxID=1962700 RepID=UPI00145CEA45|nr:sulfur carrier protein ThiS [Acidovorax sp. SRB_24]NMM76324.1 thiamine biosynthesis protein ThiS [Acidovorax sp. SRB_24]NMM76416.1 thiamine biosynthesis protein ThiS [Acidovorax sp. SRB_24]